MSPLNVNRSSRAAVVLLPPEPLWPALNAIREKHDQQRVRWMPHINLVFPFVHPDVLEKERASLIATCAEVAPFQVTLACFRYFKHSSNRASIWLDPQPREPLVALYDELVQRYPHLDTAHRFEAGFTPHLSVGQTRTLVLGRRLVESLTESWEPLKFEATELAVLHRASNDPFEVAYKVPLGG